MVTNLPGVQLINYKSLIVNNFLTAINFKCTLFFPPFLQMTPHESTTSNPSLAGCGTVHGERKTGTSRIGLKILILILLFAPVMNCTHTILVDHLQRKDNPLAEMFCAAHSFLLFILINQARLFTTHSELKSD